MLAASRPVSKKRKRESDPGSAGGYGTSGNHSGPPSTSVPNGVPPQGASDYCYIFPELALPVSTIVKFCQLADSLPSFSSFATPGNGKRRVKKLSKKQAKAGITVPSTAGPSTSGEGSASPADPSKFPLFHISLPRPASDGRFNLLASKRARLN